MSDIEGILDFIREKGKRGAMKENRVPGKMSMSMNDSKHSIVDDSMDMSDSCHSTFHSLQTTANGSVDLNLSGAADGNTTLNLTDGAAPAESRKRSGIKLKNGEFSLTVHHYARAYSASLCRCSAEEEEGRSGLCDTASPYSEYCCERCHYNCSSTETSWSTRENPCQSAAAVSPTISAAPKFTSCGTDT